MRLRQRVAFGEEDDGRVQKQGEQATPSHQQKNDVVPVPLLFEVFYVVEQEKPPEKGDAALWRMTKDALVGDEAKLVFQVHAQEKQVQYVDYKEDKEQHDLVLLRSPKQHRVHPLCVVWESITHPRAARKHGTQ